MSAGHNRLKVRLRELERRVVRFCGGLSNRDFEYDFVWRNAIGKNLRVLDVGGSESLMPLRLARRGYDVSVFDFRPYPERHPRIFSIQGDFLVNTLPAQSFDMVLFVSAIEHIGFGSYGAPVLQDGDFLAIKEAIRVLRPDGRIVITFPFASRHHVVPGFERWYDLERVQQLFSGLHVLAEEYYVPANWLFGRVVRWLPASLGEIQSHQDVLRAYGYQCNACYVVSPVARENFS